MSYSLLNRTSAPQILRLCAISFKQGVLDAYDLGDDYAAREFVDKHKPDWSYGVLGEPDDYDWKMWRFSIYRACRYNNLTKFAENYLYEVKKYNYLFCPIVFSMRFYLMGIEEWLEYPNPVNIERFKQETYIHWKPVPAGAAKMTRNEILATMQDIAYDYRRLPEEQQTVRAGVMVEFSSALFDLTRKIPVHKRIIIDGSAIKNI